MKYDDPKDRKLRMTRLAIWMLGGGLAASLVGGYFIENSLGLIVGLYVPFGTGIGGVLALFINGNVKVHQAQVGAGMTPEPPKEG
jgi:hypothetical protein